MAVVLLWSFVVMSSAWIALMLTKQSFLAQPRPARESSPPRGDDRVETQAHELAFSLPWLSRELRATRLSSWIASEAPRSEQRLVLRFDDGHRLVLGGFARASAHLPGGLAHVEPLAVRDLRLAAPDRVRLEVSSGSRSWVISAQRLAVFPPSQRH